MSESEFLTNIQQNQGIIYKLVGLYAQDTEHKKDLYQEILLQAWKGWPSFKNEAKFSTWLYRLCLNTIFTQQRKPQRIAYTDAIEPLSPVVESTNIQEENTKRLQQAIRQLSETDRAIVSMHLDGYEHGEIASVIGISTNNTAVKLHRIKQQLAQLLNHRI